MTEFDYQKILDLAATVGWGYEVRFEEHDCGVSPDWWMYITRPGKEDYGAWRTWPPGDRRNTPQAIRMMAAELGEGLLVALGLDATSQIINALACGLVVKAPDRPAKFRFRDG